MSKIINLFYLLLKIFSKYNFFKNNYIIFLLKIRNIINIMEGIMEGNTPRFYQRFENTEELESVFSFSMDHYKTSPAKSNSKHHSKHSSINHHSRAKHKKSKTSTKSKFNKQEIPNIKNFNFHSNKEVFANSNIFIIHEFFNQNKFKLNNNFDRKNSKKFLSSKKEALEKPSFDNDEIVEQTFRYHMQM